jgi:hypothetical protein
LLRNVNELIDPIIGKWYSSLVTQIFVEQDAKLILSLLVHTDMEDLIAWHYDNRGIFTIRSAYKLQRESVSL